MHLIALLIGLVTVGVLLASWASRRQDRRRAALDQERRAPREELLDVPPSEAHAQDRRAVAVSPLEHVGSILQERDGRPLAQRNRQLHLALEDGEQVVPALRRVVQAVEGLDALVIVRVDLEDVLIELFGSLDVAVGLGAVRLGQQHDEVVDAGLLTAPEIVGHGFDGAAAGLELV